MVMVIILCMVILVAYDGSQLASAETVEFSTQFCSPNKTDSTIVTKVIDCDSNYRKSMLAEQKELCTKLEKELNKECMKKASDMSAYKNVDLTKDHLKTMLIQACNLDFHKCMQDLLVSNTELAEKVKKLENFKNQKEFDKMEKCSMDAFKK